MINSSHSIIDAVCC